jgi:hypothetical protein
MIAIANSTKIWGIEMTTYSNPRMEATLATWTRISTIPNWTRVRPNLGAVHLAVETVEGKGQRATRYTLGDWPDAKPSATKRDTYNLRTRIVDGDDGKTYIIGMTMYGFVNVTRSDLKTQQETVWPKDERWASLVAMFDYSADEIARLNARLLAQESRR